MEQDKYIYFGDAYIDVQGDEKQVTQFKDDAIYEKKMVLSTKPLRKLQKKLTKKNLKIYLKYVKILQSF